MGRDKAFLEIDGVPLWQRQLQVLRELKPNEIFLAGPRRAEWVGACDEIVADVRDDAGPLAGLVAAMRRCRTPLLIALAIDLPRMTADYLCQLVQACPGEIGLVPAREDRLEPLAAVYPMGSLAFAEELLFTPRPSLQEFGRRCLAQRLLQARPIPPHEESLFLNLNTPADFALAASVSTR